MVSKIWFLKAWEKQATVFESFERPSQKGGPKALHRCWGPGASHPGAFAPDYWPYSQSICCFSSAPLGQTWIFIFDCQPVGRAHFWPFSGPKKTETTLPPAAQLASPSALHPKNSLTGINRPNQRRARIAAKNVWRDALLRGLSPSVGCRPKKRALEGPGPTPRWCSAGAGAGRCSEHAPAAPARAAPDPTRPSWAGLLLHHRSYAAAGPCFAAAFSPSAWSLLICGWGICWPARHAFLGAATRHPDLNWTNSNANELGGSFCLIFTL